MAKSDHLFGLLLALVALFGIGPGGHTLSPAASGADSLRKAVRQGYLAELGTVEATGNNDGERVAEYLAYVGLPPGHAWCAAFACWVYGRAGVPNPRTAWSPALFRRDKVIWQPSRGLKLDTPRTGDLFGIWLGGKGRIAHVGFVDRWGKDYLISVEGNTLGPGGSGKQGVYRKRRPLRSVYSVARYIRAD